MDLFDLFFDTTIFEQIATKSNEYAMATFRTNLAISTEDIRVFMAILILSGYNKVIDFKLCWSNSEDTENKMIKQAMSRDRFLMIKRCFHMGHCTEVEGDRYKKMRVLIKHLQGKFAELFVPVQALSHDEAMINTLASVASNRPFATSQSALASRPGCWPLYLDTLSPLNCIRAKVLGSTPLRM